MYQSQFNSLRPSLVRPTLAPTGQRAGNERNETLGVSRFVAAQLPVAGADAREEQGRGDAFFRLKKARRTNKKMYTLIALVLALAVQTPAADTTPTFYQIANTGPKDWSAITSSADGTKYVAVVGGPSFGNVWLSSDSGTTFEEATTRRGIDDRRLAESRSTPRCARDLLLVNRRRGAGIDRSRAGHDHRRREELGRRRGVVRQQGHRGDGVRGKHVDVDRFGRIFSRGYVRRCDAAMGRRRVVLERRDYRVTRLRRGHLDLLGLGLEFQRFFCGARDEVPVRAGKRSGTIRRPRRGREGRRRRGRTGRTVRGAAVTARRVGPRPLSPTRRSRHRRAVVGTGWIWRWTQAAKRWWPSSSLAISG